MSVPPPGDRRTEKDMEKLLAKIRRLDDSVQKVIVLGVLTSAIVAVVVVLKILG